MTNFILLLFPVFSTGADGFPSNGGGNSSSFNYSCSLSPNSQSSSSSEVQVSSPNYNVSTTSSPPVMCSLLGQAGNALAGLASPNLVLPAVLTACPSSGKGASLPFKLRHKATQGATNGTSLGGGGGHTGGANSAHNGSNSGGDGGRASLSNGSNSSVCGGLMMMNTGNDSDASSDGSSSMPQQQQQQQLSSSLEAANAFAEAMHNAAARDNALPDPELLKTENYALKSELQRLASEVATLKNVLVYSSQSVGQMSALKQQMQSVERCGTLYRPISPLGGGGNGGANGGSGAHHHHHHNSHNSHSHHSPVHFPDDLVDSKVQLLSNVIKFQKLNDIIVWCDHQWRSSNEAFPFSLECASCEFCLCQLIRA